MRLLSGIEMNDSYIFELTGTPCDQPWLRRGVRFEITREAVDQAAYEFILIEAFRRLVVDIKKEEPNK